MGKFLKNADRDVRGMSCRNMNEHGALYSDAKLLAENLNGLQKILDK